MGNFQGLLQGYLMKSTHIPDTPGRILQHRMDIGTEFRRVHRGFLLLPQSQAVFQEIGHSALPVGIDLGCGQVQGASI